MVKRLLNWPKIGVQSQFGPNFTAEFEAFFRKKLARPNVYHLALLRMISPPEKQFFKISKQV